MFKWAVFRGNGIVVGKPNHPGDFECKVFSKLLYEFHCGEGIGAVTVGNEHKVFRQLCKPPESHTHGEDAGADATVIRHLVAYDGSGGGVHNEPDISFDAADFYIGFIGSKYFSFFVGVLVNKRLNADGGGLAVVGDLLVGDADVIQVFESLRGFPQGESEVDMEGEAQGHDMCVMLTELERGSVFRQCI